MPRLLTIAICSLFAAGLTFGGEPQVRRIEVGVQSTLDPAFFIGSFGPTMAYLRETLPQLQFHAEVLPPGDLSRAIEAKRFDFVFADSGLFAVASSKFGMRDIGMQTSPRSADPSQGVSSTVIVRADDNRFRKIEDLQKATVAAESQDSLGGWTVIQGVLADRGYDIDDFFGQVIFTRGEIPDVATLVRNGYADAGIMKACDLERLMLEHNIDANAFRILEPQSGTGLRCLHSAPLYPDVVFASAREADPELVKKISIVLLSKPPSEEGYAWSIGTNFAKVDELFRTLRVGYYEYLRKANWQAIWENYRFAIFGLLAVALFAIFHIIRTNRLVHLRTAQLREALVKKDALEREARTSRERLYQMERAGVVSQMSAMLAHEVRQPVYALSNFAGGLRMYINKRYGNDNIVQETTEAIANEANRISDIVEKVRSYAKQQAAKDVRIEMGDLVNSALRTFNHSAASEGITITTEGDKATALSGDPLELELVLLNLMKNSAAAMANQADKQLSVKWEQNASADTVFIRVEDNGPQMSDDAFNSLACPVQSMKAEGLGIGLSLCRTIVERHGGQLSFERRTRGLTAVLSLPAFERKAPPATVKA